MYALPEGAPDWFVDNLRHPGESRTVDYAGSHVHFLAWNWERRELPVLLLLHGFSGHANWWSFLAPFFADRYRIAAVDLPGMGDSGRLEEYGENSYTEGVLAFLREEGLEAVTVVAHSFGGIQTLRAMYQAPAAFRHSIIVDSFVCLPPIPPPPVLNPRDHHRMYASREECMGRFRLVPPQGAADPVIQDFVAWHSCEQGPEGWHWKFDPRAKNMGEALDPADLARISARVDFIYGDKSIFHSDGRPGSLLEAVGNPGEAVIVPEAHHHLMIDHPLELVAQVNRLLAAG
ncbi:alpha/beta fold hydrolase [Haliea sp. E17]|uniref:alpha/beta fold hydrolase n=1 Tax=Haliea sp. E17 TaxID=3401576 RepID=UPI003AABF442